MRFSPTIVFYSMLLMYLGVALVFLSGCQSTQQGYIISLTERCIDIDITESFPKRTKLSCPKDVEKADGTGSATKVSD
jgi:hypothetical protein